MKKIFHYIFLLATFLLLSCQPEKWEVDVPAKESIYELTEVTSGKIKIDLMEVYRTRPLMIQFVANQATAFKTSDFVDNSTTTNFDFSFKIVSEVEAARAEGEKVERIDEYICSGSKLDGKSTMEVTTTIGTSVTTTSYTMKIAETEKYTPSSEEYHYKAAWDSSAVNVIMVDTFLTFTNKSVGCKSHEWIIEEGNGFLKKGFNVDDDLRQQLVEGLSSNEDTVCVLFGKTGVSSVTLRNVYDKPVALEDGSLRAIQDETTGDWVITKKFEVNVYGGLEPRFKITNMATGETMDEKSESITWTIEAGQKIKVEDLTESDRPDARTWNVEGSSEKTSTEEFAEFTFAVPGEYSGFTFVAKRTQPAAVAVEVTKNIPLKVIVKKSEKPFTMQSVSISSEANSQIVIKADGAFKNENLEQAVADFTLTVNGVDGNPVENLAVSEINVLADGNLALVLSDRIYEGETVKLSYNGDKLTSVDERTLSSFDNAEAVNSIKDISVLPLNEGKNVNSFEGGTGFWLTNEWWAANFFYGNQVGVNGVVQGSSEQACEGSRSLKISYLETTSIDEGKKNDQMQIMYAKAHYSPTIPVGNYKFSFNIYITSDSNNNIKSKNFWFYYGTDGNASTKIADFSFNQTRGEWVKLSKNISLNNDIQKFSLKLTVPSCNALQSGVVFYIDDIQLIPVR